MHADYQELDLLLGELADCQPPPLTVGFQYGVWRKIRQRQQMNASEWSFREMADWLLDAALRPRPVLAALALALTLGVFVGAATLAKPRVQLDAFSANAPGLLFNSIK